LIDAAPFKALLQLRADFNVFSLFDDAIVENSYSRMLSFLLDSREQHGLGDTLLKEWLKRVSGATLIHGLTVTFGNGPSSSDAHGTVLATAPSSVCA
jgi:hypothetical protein